MPRPGPKPTPTALHRLRGTFNATRHGRDRKGEPEAVGNLSAQAPEWMTPGQQESWAYAMAHAPAGLLKPIDRGVLAVWVEAEDRHRVAMTQQAKLDAGSTLPLLTKGRDGQPSPPLTSASSARPPTPCCAPPESWDSARPHVHGWGAPDRARRTCPRVKPPGPG
jgi:phage terminase small subunit